MKKLLLIVGSSFLLLSCGPTGGKHADKYYERYYELEIKNKELDYIERLYSIKESITFEQKIKTIDSLIYNSKIK